MKNVKSVGFRGKKMNSAVNIRGSNSAAKTQKLLGSKFRGPRKTVGPSDHSFQLKVV